MANVEKMTISVSKAAAIVGIFCSILISGFTVYFAAMNGVRDGFDKVNERITGNELKIQQLQSDVGYVRNDMAMLKGIVMTFREATKPEKPEIESGS